jgi:hypothetical protein
MEMFTTPKDINMFFLLATKSALKLEIYGMHRKGMSATKQVQNILNVKIKDKQELFKMFTDYINALKEI